MAQRSGFAASTAAVGAATAISRVAGLIRDVLAAALLGAGPTMSAFQIAFNLPNLIRSIVADNAISAAFVPVFVELREQGREDEAWRAAGAVLWIAAIGLGLLSALAVAVAPWIVPLFVPGRGVSAELTTTLTRWMFPIIALLGMTGVVIGILQSYRRFALAAFAPVVWNAVLIASLAACAATAASTRRGIEIYAVGMLVATTVQLVILVPSLRRLQRETGAQLGFELSPSNPHVRRILRLMVPVSIGLGLININLTIDLAVASLVSGNGPAQLNFAFRLFMLPQGLFSVAVATVLFPEMSRLAALGDTSALSRRVADGLRSVIFLLLPAAAVMAVLAVPITRLVYQRGSFTPADTSTVAAVLIAFSVGLVFNGMCLLLTRAFFSLQLAAIPTWIAAANLVLNTVLDVVLYRPFGVVGIAAATSAVTVANAAALAVLLRHAIGHLHLREVANHATRATLVATCAAVAGWTVEALAGGALGLVAALAAAAAVYLGGTHGLGVREARFVLRFGTRVAR